MRLSVLSLCFLWCATLAAQVAPPTFGDHDAAWWRERLLTAPAESRARLAAGLADDRPEVAQTVARLCESIGATAAPLVPDLVDLLSGSPEWWSRVYCANALAAIGAASPQVCDALFAQVTASDVPRLRNECLRALARLDADVAQRLLAAVETGAWPTLERASEALGWLGAPVIGDLVGALERDTAANQVARAALLRIGWRAVDRLERAGHGDLAQRVLREGPLHGIAFVDEFVLSPTPPQPPASQLPAIEWEVGYGHGHGLQLFRGTEDAEGFRIDVIAMATVFDEQRRATVVVTTRWTRIPRTVALGATRQLAAIAGMELRAKPDDDPDGASRGRTTGNFHARVRAATGGEALLEASFAGYPASDNVAARFHAEAAVAVLREALHGAQWHDRAVTAADRDRVAARRAEDRDEVRWVTERLQEIDAALRAR